MNTQIKVRQLIAEAYDEVTSARIIIMGMENVTSLKAIAQLRRHLNAASAKVESAETLINNSTPSERELLARMGKEEKE